MEFIINNWYMIVVIVVVAINIAYTSVLWVKQPKDKTYQQIRGWLLQAVMLAEKEFGSGTGKLKLSSVYDRFCERMPWVAKLITFEKFSGCVDDALQEMHSIIENNNAIASIVEKS